MFPAGTNTGSDENPLNVRLPAAVSKSLTVKDIGPATVSSEIVCGKIGEITGFAFAAPTFAVKPWLTTLFDAPSSRTWTVTNAVPIALSTSAKETNPVLFALL